MDDQPTLTTFNVNGIRMRAAVQGSGPLVLLCHGFPESWVSWRSQLAALAQAGYRAVAPDMRGYGGTDAPADADQYTLLHTVGDLTELVLALGERQAVVVGHDWGAPAAWHAALLRPAVFRAVVGLSVPYQPPARLDMLSALERKGVRDFYIQYFQQPGVAEAELQADVGAALRRITFNLSGEGDAQSGGMLAPGRGFLDAMREPAQMPAWVVPEDLAYAIAEFERTGFRGALNWYRSVRRSWELLTPWRDAPIDQPSLFIAGERDDVLRFAGKAIERFGQTLPGLRGCHVLPEAGHWVQRERADRVNALLLEFLRGL